MMFFRRKEEKFVSPMEGTLIRLEDVPDAVFSEKMMGDGFAVELTGGCITAPVSGVLESAFPTGHAFGIRTREGMEVLLHIGLDTVQLKGKGFEVQVRQGGENNPGSTPGESRFELYKKHRKICHISCYIHQRRTDRDFKRRRCKKR